MWRAQLTFLRRVLRDEVPEFINHLPACKVDIALQDPQDPRYQFVLELRERAGAIFHRGVQALKATAGQESSIDAVKMLISSIRVLELDYPCDHNHYGAVKKSYEFALNISRTTRNQREFPRFVWVRRASLYQASRLRLNSFYRKRSKLDDLLIQDLCDLSLSVYLQVRRSAQRGLDSMSEASLLFVRPRETRTDGNASIKFTSLTERGRSSTTASLTLSSVRQWRLRSGVCSPR